MLLNSSKFVFRACQPLLLKIKSHSSLLNKPQTGNSQSFIPLRFGSSKAKTKTKTLHFNNMGRKAKNKRPEGEKAAVKTKPTTSRPLQKIPSSINLVVVGTGGPGTSRCLLLTTEHSRYMFNCGEGSQRLTVMNKSLKSSAFAKVSGVENIFITHKNWENTGGLLGIAMLVESQKNPEIKNYLHREKQKLLGAQETPKSLEGLPELTLYGPDGIEKITMMARKFAERSNMNIVRKDGVFEDFAVKISPIKMAKKGGQAQAVSNCGMSEINSNTSESAESMTEPEQIYAYICTAKPAPPKINVEKCVDAGITMGPMVGELQRGNPVTLPDGTVVRPEQVTDVPPSLQNAVLVVECPSEDYFDSLKDSAQLNHYRGEERQASLAIVAHMTPALVLNSPYYQDWMHSFGEETDHLVMNDDSSAAELSRVNIHQAQLNVVHPQVFPLLPRVASNQTVEGDSQVASNQTVEGDSSDNNHHHKSKGVVRKACSGLVYSLRGKNLGFHVDMDDIDVESIQQDLLETAEVKQEVDKLKTNQVNVAGASQYPRVVFLGTGSSEPNRIRAQSCIAVHLSEDTVIVLDCGEDSFGQFFRFYGKEESSRTLLKLKAIFISHMHGDHHLGLLTLLKERRKAFETHNVPFVPVLLMAPIQMKRWLKFYHCEVEEIVHLFRFHKHQRDLKEFDDFLVMNTATDQDIHNTLAFTQYSPVEVIHARNSYGITFTLQSGFKLVYSGDTRPCDRLVEAGQDCDLLIHEATHEDALLPHAKSCRHTTFSEAMDVGKQMRAKQVILTHFSQRYAHMVPFQGMAVPENVGVAFDNMQVTQDTMPLLSSFIPSLTQIFSDKLQKHEIKSMKRNREQAELDES